jgi:hypothetical protein
MLHNNRHSLLTIATTLAGFSPVLAQNQSRLQQDGVHAYKVYRGTVPHGYDNGRNLFDDDSVSPRVSLPSWGRAHCSEKY